LNHPPEGFIKRCGFNVFKSWAFFVLYCPLVACLWVGFKKQCDKEIPDNSFSSLDDPIARFILLRRTPFMAVVNA
jgi:hypothetical protein